MFILAPFGPPDCVWVKMANQSPVPPQVVVTDGKLNGDPVYIGRVYDNGYFIGTAVPSKGICSYISKDGELKSSSSYEILTVECGSPLEFRSDVQFDDALLFVAGCDEDETFYVGRYVDHENTYFGWAQPSTKILYIPRDSKLGSQKAKENYDIMVHRYLDRLCICPPCPHPE
ncbi:uncharacterized protein LOC118194901 [Stegodyphus dumicola]|uniref:uncharacterized protein LOC118194901 n=1 Tax=Stegodyphus dumicola TaxID=202533 RepID=UPI0015A7D160|nr:uncharacterized protein LOC118194901 [Stegodyphus dumicola]